MTRAHKPAADEGKLLTPRVAAFRLGVDEETLRRWIRKGAIQVVKVGPHRRQRITEAEVERQKIQVA